MSLLWTTRKKKPIQSPIPCIGSVKSILRSPFLSPIILLIICMAILQYKFVLVKIFAQIPIDEVHVYYLK